jgi:hypothetical protein
MPGFLQMVGRDLIIVGRLKDHGNGPDIQGPEFTDCKPSYSRSVGVFYVFWELLHLL